MEKLIIIGAGGYAKSVLDSVDIYNYEISGFLDEFSDNPLHLGYPILARGLNGLGHPERYVYFISIGNNQRRKAWYDRLEKNNYRVINVVDKSAIVSPQAKIGNGCFVGKMAIINSNATVGNNCIINTKGSFIGRCSVTIGQISIGNWSTIGAGSVVTKNIGSGVTAVGVPAQVIKEGAMLG